MGIGISYMGTKRELAPLVADVIADAAPGSMLDVFSGMCSVAEAVSDCRQVWTNDVQIFSAAVGAALFTSKDEPLRPAVLAEKNFDQFSAHSELLSASFVRSLSVEGDVLASVDYVTFHCNYAKFKSVLDVELASISASPFSLFSKIYADSYFGLKQVIEIDSILCSIDCCQVSGSINEDHARWARVCLGRAMLRVANSTGHFAQFLKPKEDSYRTFQRQRRRSVWAEWLVAADDVSPIRDEVWRSRNRSFNKDCVKLIDELRFSAEKPSIIYADPPYTDDQYSRYYHILETLMLYDYPEVSGAGLYRGQRFRTPFSVKRMAEGAVEALIKGVAAVGADLVLSYPTNGLLYEAGSDPQDIIRRHFRRVELCHAVSHNHSTFGASKGPSKASVTEQIFIGRS